LAAAIAAAIILLADTSAPSVATSIPNLANSTIHSVVMAYVTHNTINNESIFFITSEIKN